MLWFLVKFWDTELYEGKQEESQILIDYLLSYILPEFQRNKSLRELSIRCNAFLNGLLELHLSIPFPPLSGLDVFGERAFPKEKAPPKEEKAPAKPTTPKPPTAKPPQKTTPPPKTKPLGRRSPTPEAPSAPPTKRPRSISTGATKRRPPQIQEETQPTEEEEPTEEPEEEPEEETPEEEKPEEEEFLGTLIGEGNIIYPLEWEKGEVRFPIWWSRADILTPRFFKVVLRADPLHNALLIRSKNPGSTNMYIIPPPPR